MIVLPAIVKCVGESEEAIFWCSGGQFLPHFVLIAGAGKHHDTIDFLMLGKTCGSGRTMRGTGDDDSIPSQHVSIGPEKGIPAGLRIFLGEPFHELQGALHHAIGLGDSHGVAEVLTGSGFETHFGEKQLFRRGLVVIQFSEPAIGVVHLNRVKSIRACAVKEFRIMRHQPDDQFPLRCDAGVHGRMLQVGGLTLFFEKKIDFGMRADSWIDKARPLLEFVVLRLFILVSRFLRGQRAD